MISQGYKIYNVEKYRDFEIPVKSQSKSLIKSTTRF